LIWLLTRPTIPARPQRPSSQLKFYTSPQYSTTSLSKVRRSNKKGKQPTRKAGSIPPTTSPTLFHDLPVGPQKSGLATMRALKAFSLSPRNGCFLLIMKAGFEGFDACTWATNLVVSSARSGPEILLPGRRRQRFLPKPMWRPP
jgi:hypothetical protein